MQPFDDLLARLGVDQPVGAAETEIRSFETAAGRRLPPEVWDYFRTCNGARFGSAALRLFSLDQARERYDLMRGAGAPDPIGCVAVADGFDSDPLCVCTEPPLAGYLLHLRHDGYSGPAFRSIANFLAALAPVLDAGPPEGEWFPMDRIPYDFATPERTPEDVATGRRLLASAAGMPEPRPGSAEAAARALAYRYAVILLSDAEVADVAGLLDQVRDFDILHEVEARLREMAPRVPAAADALRQRDAAQIAFLEECREALTAAGMWSKVERREYPASHTLVVRGGLIGTSFDGRSLYARRDDPGLKVRIVENARKTLAKRH